MIIRKATKKDLKILANFWLKEEKANEKYGWYKLRKNTPKYLWVRMKQIISPGNRKLRKMSQITSKSSFMENSSPFKAFLT